MSTIFFTKEDWYRCLCWNFRLSKWHSPYLKSHDIAYDVFNAIESCWTNSMNKRKSTIFRSVKTRKVGLTPTHNTIVAKSCPKYYKLHAKYAGHITCIKCDKNIEQKHIRTTTPSMSIIKHRLRCWDVTVWTWALLSCNLLSPSHGKWCFGGLFGWTYARHSLPSGGNSKLLTLPVDSVSAALLSIAFTSQLTSPTVLPSYCCLQHISAESLFNETPSATAASHETLTQIRVVKTAHSFWPVNHDQKDRLIG